VEKKPPAPSAEAGQAEEYERARLEREKLRLETEKLGLETESLHRSLRLADTKVRYEIRELKEAPRRAWISTAVTTLLGLATVLLGIAGFRLNSTISSAADEQRRSDYFSKLSEQFAKPGTSRVGAIVGFRTFLAPGSDRASQTATLLANDLVSETDPLAVDAIVLALEHGGLEAFEQVRAVNVDARQRLQQTSFRYLSDMASNTYSASKLRLATSWPDFVLNYAMQARGSGPAALTDYAENDPHRHDPTGGDDAALVKIQDMLQADRETDPFSVIALRPPAPNPSPKHRLEDYARETKALVATSVILGSLLQDHHPMPPQPALPSARLTDAISGSSGSGIAVFGVDLINADLSEMDLSGSYIDGSADGATFSLTNLSHAFLVASVGPSASGIATFCGSNLTAANLASVDEVVHNKDQLPDFTASNWWDAAVLSTEARAAIQASYPKAQQQPIFLKPTDEKRRVCAERRRRAYASTTAIFSYARAPN
jgi:hypothetical protein